MTSRIGRASFVRPLRSPMPDLNSYLEAAAAHPELKKDVLEFVDGRETSRIALEGHAPRVKVERVLTQLFHTHPELPIERVRTRSTFTRGACPSSAMRL